VKSIIPAPRTFTSAEGFFPLSPSTRICVEPGLAEPGRLLAERMRASTGLPLPIVSRARWAGPDADSILLVSSDRNQDLGPEGYRLAVTRGSVTISAGAPAGVFYGTQSLLQLLPAEVLSPTVASPVEWRIPCVQIEDAPRFPWRGFMLDTARHFFTGEEIKRFLDLLALHKMNTFHWHLTEDQGWRLAIQKYPRLTEVGAWRPGVGFGLDPTSTTAYGPDGRYGGFYSREDVREIVAYARERSITIVPEIEMPGHATAALAAFPELGCTGGPYDVELTGGIFHGIFCAGREETFAFLHDVLDEVVELFPGKYIHIGGDEAPKDNWKKCPRCQARMKTEGLRDEHELQSYFIRRIEGYVNGHGRTLIGWSEIREGGLARSAVVMDWIGGAVEAARDGHDVVMSPTGFCYLDYKQGVPPEPGFTGSYLPLAKTYAFEPIPQGLDPRFHGHILGGQGNLWTELVPSMRSAEYMTFPRLGALAEALWSEKAVRNEESFLLRLGDHRQRLDALRVNYCRIALPPAGATPIGAAPSTVTAVPPIAPAPFGPVPSARQLRWHDLEYYGFLHFTVNTFTDKEWGYGDEAESVFDPERFDADQMAVTAAQAGMKGLILTCKHHDGFCLWPSKYTEHSVKKSPWKQGRGDAVREVAEACAAHGLRFGVYLSPWDRNRNDYGKPTYVEYFRNQLRELLTGYGPLFEVWFDGANGGDGFYGGAREERRIDHTTYYGWQETWKLVRELQPDACIWSDAGPDVRWVGNETGQAGETCWATLNSDEVVPGKSDPVRLNRGDLAGRQWVPAECDVSIRPGWFHHAAEDGKVKTPRELLDLYFASVGRGASLLLNVPPDRHGRLCDQDVSSLREFRQVRDVIFAHDLARDGSAAGSSTRATISGSDRDAP
jgi:alpha-L-fucosidase